MGREVNHMVNNKENNKKFLELKNKFVQILNRNRFFEVNYKIFKAKI